MDDQQLVRKFTTPKLRSFEFLILIILVFGGNIVYYYLENSDKHIVVLPSMYWILGFLIFYQFFLNWQYCQSVFFYKDRIVIKNPYRRSFREKIITISDINYTEITEISTGKHTTRYLKVFTTSEEVLINLKWLPVSSWKEIVQYWKDNMPGEIKTYVPTG
jgi:hypothetical protein